MSLMNCADLNKYFFTHPSFACSTRAFNLPPSYTNRIGLKIAMRGYAICKFKEGESLFAKETEYVGREQYVSESVNIFKCRDEAPKSFKPDKYTFKF